MDPKIIEQYDRLRPLASKPFRSACYAPFTSLLFDTTGVVRACCVNWGYLLGDIRRQRLRDIWNGERIQRMREALRNYDFSLGCGYCEWKISCGEFENKDLANSNLITYKYDRLTVSADGAFWPRHMEFHISNTCNLACATCWGEFSTVIRNSREKLPPLPKAYTEEFFTDLVDFLPHLEEAQFLGGEPFLIKEHQRVWDMLIEAGLSPKCHVVTNGTQFNERVERVLNSLPVSLAVSVDGATRETFEKIRVNAKFDEVMTNIRGLRDLCHARGTGFTLMCTLSRLNWFEFGDILLLAEDLGVPVSVTTLWEPRRYSLYTLSGSDLRQVLDSMSQTESRIISRLAINEQVWRNHVHELRQHYAQIVRNRDSTSKTASDGLAVLHDAASQRIDEFAADLRAWATDFPVVRVDHDAGFTIGRIAADGASQAAFPGELVGRTMDDLIVAMKRAFGSRVHVLDEQTEDGCVRRLVQFIDPVTDQAVLVRLGSFGAQPGEPGTMVFGGLQKLDSRLAFV